MPKYFGNKYVKGITQYIPMDHFGALDFIDYHAAAAGMTRVQWMATYGSRLCEDDKKPGPDTYMKDLNKEEEEDKEEQIDKQADMSDDDPKAYKDMPGDEEAREEGKVKKSKHTKKFHELYGEALKEEAEGDRGPIDNPDIETALKKKAEVSGVPIEFLRIIMRRGLAAWKSGHRPGATQEQWGYARVNSFLTKGEGTWGNADEDVAKEVRDGGYDKNMKS